MLNPPLGWSVCVCVYVYKGTSKRRRKEEMTGKNVKRPQHELDHHGLVPLPVKVCYTCNRYATSSVSFTCLHLLHLQQEGCAVSGAAYCMSPVLNAATGGAVVQLVTVPVPWMDVPRGTQLWIWPVIISWSCPISLQLTSYQPLRLQRQKAEKKNAGTAINIRKSLNILPGCRAYDVKTL